MGTYHFGPEYLTNCDIWGVFMQSFSDIYPQQSWRSESACCQIYTPLCSFLIGSFILIFPYLYLVLDFDTNDFRLKFKLYLK